MGQSNLNRIFRPRRVAVMGASEKPGTIGNIRVDTIEVACNCAEPIKKQARPYGPRPAALTGRLQ